MTNNQHALKPVVFRAAMRYACRNSTAIVSECLIIGESSQRKVTYTGRIRKPSFMMQLMYGRCLKSENVGNLSKPQRESNSS